jgi:hypothetical protein
MAVQLAYFIRASLTRLFLTRLWRCSGLPLRGSYRERRTLTKISESGESGDWFAVQMRSGLVTTACTMDEPVVGPRKETNWLVNTRTLVKLNRGFSTRIYSRAILPIWEERSVMFPNEHLNQFIAVRLITVLYYKRYRYIDLSFTGPKQSSNS